MLSYAIQKCREHDSGGRVNVYAVACDRRGNIICEAGNSYISSNKVQRFFAKAVGLDDKVYSHAETKVIAMLAGMRKSCHTLYIARATPDSLTALPAAPCAICSEAIRYSQIKNVVHT